MTIRAWILALWMPLTVACMSNDAEERAERVYHDLRAREDAHHAAVMHTADPAFARDDTLDYQRDMRALMGDMMDACSDMMDSDMMGRGDYESLQAIAGRVQQTMDAHASMMGSLDAIEPMHDDCVAHHLDMTHMMDEMRDAMPDAVTHDGMM
jgi:hypothetical protein